MEKGSREEARVFNSWDEAWDFCIENRSWLVEAGGWYRMESIKEGIVPEKYLVYSTSLGYIRGT